MSDDRQTDPAEPIAAPATLTARQVGELLGKSGRQILNLRQQLGRGTLGTNRANRPEWNFTADDVEAFRQALATAKPGWTKGKKRESKPKAPWSEERRARYEKTIAKRQGRKPKKP